ncbi:MAG: DNA polymerase III subunit delta [Candidatus Omnitrophota bacterium]
MNGRIFIFLGKENFLKEEALEELKKKTFSGTEADLNYTVFYAGELESCEFYEAVNIQPFLSQRRLVVIKDIEDLSDAAKNSVISYAKNPNESTILALTSDLEIKDLDSRKDDFFSEISKYAEKRAFDRLKGQRLFDYLARSAALDNKRITKEAVCLLVEKLDNDLRNLKAALEGLITYIGDAEEIGKEDVEALVGKSAGESVFNLTKAVCGGQAAVSLSILADLLRDSVSPESVIGAIGAEFRRLLKVKYLIAQGRTQWQIQNELKLSQPAAAEAIGAVNSLRLSDIKRNFSYLSKADSDCKSRDLDKRAILESLIVRLAVFAKEEIL